MINYKEALEPDCTYHIYNRAVGNEKLFITEANYKFFLKKYQEYISPFADTFCYCLMPNHFHLLIRIKEKNKLKPLINQIQKVPEYCSLQFSNFFNSYSKAFNKQEKRKGVLFMRPYSRKKISDMDYFRKVVLYIHRNPVVAGLCSKPIEWRYSSYKSLLTDSATLLKREEVVDVFGDKENFRHIHEGQKLMEKLI